jgi:hypothetical protein
MRTLKRILGVLLIFVFGFFVGSVITGAGLMNKLRDNLLGGPEAVMDIVVKRLDHELKLDPEQKRKLQVIVDDARIKLRQSRAKIQPEVEDALHEAEDHTRAILYPDQVKKFDAILHKSREKWKVASPSMAHVPATPAPDAELPAPSTPPPDIATPAPATPTPATPAPSAANDAK